MNLKKFFFSLFSILSIIGYGYFVFAAAPSGGYNPGQILDPDCAPGDVDCVVKLQTSGGGTPAGSDTQIQYNNAGVFGANSDFTFDPATSVFTVTKSFPKTITLVQFEGSGLNDITTSGSFTGTKNTQYRIIIDSEGAPDTFSWEKDGLTQATNVPITGTAQLLDDGVSVIFGATTGHTIGDSSIFYGTAFLDTALSNAFDLSAIFGGEDASLNGQVIQDGTFLALSGLTQSPNNTGNGVNMINIVGDIATGSLTNFVISKNGFFTQSSDGLATSAYSVNPDGVYYGVTDGADDLSFQGEHKSFFLRNTISSVDYGISQESGAVTVGNLSGGNGTSITIDDIAQTINFNNNYSFPFADGAAGQVLGTDGSGQLGWVTVSGGGSSPTLTNGLQFIGGDIGLGGTLTGNTAIDQDGYDFLVQDGENSFGLLHFPGGLISGIMHYEPGVERYGISYLDISGAKSINLSYSSETSLKSHGFTLNNDIVSMSSRSASASENFWTSIYIESNQQEIKMTGSNDLNTGNTVWQNTALSDLTGDTHADLATIRNDGTWRWNFYPNTRNDSATVTPINFLYTDALGNIFSAPKALILGTGTTAPSFSEYAAGSYNTAYTPASAFIWSATDRLFTIGNGLATGFESDAFTILKNGETGIGIDNFETNTNGNIFQVGDGSTSVIGYVDDVTGNWVNVSDERKKNNIQDLSYGLHEILQLRPTSFDYKRNGEHAIGFIAQEVLPIIPESVYGSESDGYGMSYATLTPVIVKAIQEMNLNITELTNMERPNTWRDSLIAWFGNVENGITEFIAGTIRAKTQICIDDVCMTKDQLRQVLEQNNIQNTVDLSGDIVQPDENSDTQLTPTDTPVDTSTDVPVDDSTTPTEDNTDTTELTSITSDVSAEQSPE